MTLLESTEVELAKRVVIKYEKYLIISYHILMLLFLICSLLGCVSIQGDNTIKVKDIKDEWSKIKSFEALVTYTINNKTYTSKVLFAKPNKALKEDINCKNITSVILIINDTEIIASNGKRFVLNATKSDIDALDPFIAILNNIDLFRFEYYHDALILMPKSPELPKYVIKLNNGLPKRITITQQNQTLAVVEYIKNHSSQQRRYKEELIRMKYGFGE